MLDARGVLLMAALGGALSGAVHAQTPTATISLRAMIAPACAAGSLDYGVLDFGSHGSLSNQVEASSSVGGGTIQVTCVNGLSYSIRLDGGLYGNGTQRYMRSAAGAAISYQLFGDAQFNVPWNVGIALNQTGTGSLQQIPLYGRVPAQTTPAAGTYSDIVRVTVEW